MKKNIYILMVASAFIFASCSKNDNPIPQQEEIKLNLKIGNPNSNTKVAKKTWAAGDKLNLFIDALEDGQLVPDLIITFDGTEWKVSSMRPGFTPSASGKLYLIYEEYNDLSAAHYTPSLSAYDHLFYTAKKSKEQPETDKDSYCWPLNIYAHSIDYSYSANTLTSTVENSDWKYYSSFKVLINSHASLSKSADSYNLQVSIKSGETTTYAPTFKGWNIDKNNTWVLPTSANNNGWSGGVQESDGIAFYYGNVVILSSKTVTFTLKEYGGTTKTYSVTGKTLITGTTACSGVTLDYNNFTVPTP